MNGKWQSKLEVTDFEGDVMLKHRPFSIQMD